MADQQHVTAALVMGLRLAWTLVTAAVASMVSRLRASAPPAPPWRPMARRSPTSPAAPRELVDEDDALALSESTTCLL